MRRRGVRMANGARVFAAVAITLVVACASLSGSLAAAAPTCSLPEGGGGDDGDGSNSSPTAVAAASAALIRRGDYEAALAQVACLSNDDDDDDDDDAAEAPDASAVVWNNAGVAEWMLGHAAAAEEHFARAADAVLVDSMLDSVALRRAPWLVDALKNLRWAAQARNDGDLAEHLKAAVRRAVATLLPSDLEAAPPVILSSLNVFDVSLGGLVCAHVGSPGGHASGGGQSGEDATSLTQRLYIDHVKRSASYFIGGAIPHRLFPGVGSREEAVYDIQYRMRDFQTEPPPDGRPFEDGATIKEGGVLDLVTLAIETVLGVRGGAPAVAGDVLEAGTWRGGTAVVAAATLAAHAETGASAGRRVVVADSFRGIPADSLVGWQQRYAIPRSAVEDTFARHGLLNLAAATAAAGGGGEGGGGEGGEGGEGGGGDGPSYHVRGAPPLVFVEGFFNESLPRYAAANPSARVAVLLSDSDAYSSTIDTLVNAYPLLSPGGFVVIDDFHIPECRAAVLEYRAARGIVEPMLPAPCDYIYACRKTPRGTPVGESFNESIIAPHSMYWRRERAESELQPAPTTWSAR